LAGEKGGFGVGRMGTIPAAEPQVQAERDLEEDAIPIGGPSDDNDFVPVAPGRKREEKE